MNRVADLAFGAAIQSPAIDLENYVANHRWPEFAASWRQVREALANQQARAREEQFKLIARQEL